MPSRRHLIIGGAAILSAAGTLHWVAAQASLTVTAARQFLQRSGDKLASVLNGPGEWPEKRDQVEARINQTMDVYGVARFALGRAWTATTDPQRSEIVRLFPRVPAGNVATTVLRPGDAPRRAIWMVTSVAGAPKIVDTIAEGTSMRITQRDGCAGFLRQHGYSIPALIETSRREADVTS